MDSESLIDGIVFDYASMAEKMRELPFDSKLFLTVQVLDQSKEDLALSTQRRITYAMYAGKLKSQSSIALP
jgi:hypothetical protein